MMTAAGTTRIGTEPRPGSHGATVAFIHPKGSFGTLIELVQESFVNSQLTNVSVNALD